MDLANAVLWCMWREVCALHRTDDERAAEDEAKGVSYVSYLLCQSPAAGGCPVYRPSRNDQDRQYETMVGSSREVSSLWYRTDRLVWSGWALRAVWDLLCPGVFGSGGSDQHGVTMRLQDALDRIRERDRVMRHRESQQKYFEKNREMVNEKKRIARAGGWKPLNFLVRYFVDYSDCSWLSNCCKSSKKFVVIDLSTALSEFIEEQTHDGQPLLHGQFLIIFIAISISLGKTLFILSDMPIPPEYSSYNVNIWRSSESMWMSISCGSQSKK